MRNFVIFFIGGEGTSPLVRLLNNFNQISILQQTNHGGWEPFDQHHCGNMNLRDLKQCLDIIFKNGAIDFEQLNNIYTKTAPNPLEANSNNGVVGFKMRFYHQRNTSNIAAFLPFNKLLIKLLNKYHYFTFRSMMLELLKRNNVTVFVAIRRDVLKWGLSRYHGDGTGKSGHLQFKLASGRISHEEVGKFNVDCNRLEKIILRLESHHTRKRKLMEEFNSSGIKSYPLYYEEFLTDKQKYFTRLFDLLELQISKEEIDESLKSGAYFKKVHSDDISEVVINHQEVIEKFGHRTPRWP